MPPQRPIEHVTWEDSCATQGWHKFNEFPSIAEVDAIHSIGYVVYEDKHALTITTSLSTFGSIMDPLTIPKRAIISRHRVKVK